MRKAVEVALSAGFFRWRLWANPWQLACNRGLKPAITSRYHFAVDKGDTSV